MPRKAGRPAIPEATPVGDVAGMVILAGPIAAVDARNKLPEVAPEPEDPLRLDWKELSSPDSWNVNAVYDFGVNELLARELVRWAKEFGGEHGRMLRRRAAWLRSPKTGVSRNSAGGGHHG